MATRSAIGILNSNNVRSVYCHFDGYLEGVGETLVNHYTDKKKINSLIDLGSISVLGEELEAEGEHTFREPEEGVTVAYGRDRGEDVEINTMSYPRGSSYEDILEKLYNFYQTGEYVYLYIPKEKRWVSYSKSYEGTSEIVDVKSGNIITKEKKIYKITREDSVDYARRMRMNKDTIYKLMSLNGNILITEDRELNSPGFEDLGYIGWRLVESKLKSGKLTQKKLADFLYHQYNERYAYV